MLFSRPDIRLTVGSYVNCEIIYIVNAAYFQHAIKADPSMKKLIEMFDPDNQPKIINKS